MGNDVQSNLIQEICPNCGDKMQFNATKGVLFCDSCGHTKTIDRQNNRIIERSFHEALRVQDAKMGMGIETTQISCKGCGAVTMITVKEPTVSCSFCGSQNVNPSAFTTNVIQPAGILPFVINKEQSQNQFKEWIGSGWFRPNDLAKIAQLSKLDGVYIPYWTYDANTDSSWTADAGYYYYVDVPYTDTQGKSQTRKEQRVRWEPANGFLRHHFDDVLVPASKGLSLQLTKEIEPFDLRKVVNYESKYLLGWKGEVYSIDLEQGFSIGEQIMDNIIEQKCIQMIPGDTHRNLYIHTEKYQITFKHLLLPIWIAAYQYNNKIFQVVINGQTGKISGDKPFSWIKITFAIIVVVIIVALFFIFTKK